MKKVLIYTISFLLWASCQKEKVPPIINFSYTIAENGVLDGFLISEQANYAVDFGDGTTVLKGNSLNNIPVSISHKYTQKGTFTVLITISNKNGVSTQQKQVTIHTLAIKPTAIFTYETKEDGRIYLNFILNEGDSFEIDYGNNFIQKGLATNSGIRTYSYQYPSNGTYNLSFKVTNLEGFASTSQTINITNVIPPPIADFSYEILENGNVKFINLSKNATKFRWSIDNFFTTQEKEPIIKFDINQYYSVQLRAENDYANDTVIMKISVASTKKQSEFIETDNSIGKSFLIDNQNYILNIGFHRMNGMPYQYSISLVDKRLVSIYNKIYEINLSGFEKKYTFDGQYCCPSLSELFNVLKSKLTKINDPDIIDVKEEDLDTQFYNNTEQFCPKAFWVRYKVNNGILDGELKVRLMVYGVR